MTLRLIFFLFLLCSAEVCLAADKVVLITLDVLRWQ